MPISFKSKLSSTVANATWLDKTIDDATVGKFSLRESSSADVEDVQLFLNTLRADIDSNDIELADHEIRIIQNTPTAIDAQLLIDGDAISLNATKYSQYIRVKGSTLPVVLAAIPFDVTAIDLSNIIIVGQSDTETVTITHNDFNGGCLLNGDATLFKGYLLELIYDNTLLRYIEKSRNF
jgi:hypothetical protein